MWPIAEAKQKLTEVVNRALAEGPQVISKHGIEQVVILSVQQYRELTNTPRYNFKQHLLSGPSLDDVPIKRDKSPIRPVDF